MCSARSKSIVAFFLVMFLSSTASIAEEFPCGAVDVLAKLYAHDIISVTVLQDKGNRECIFSINGATEETVSEGTLAAIEASLGSLGYLIRYYRGEVSEKERAELGGALDQLVKNFAALLSAPRLENGDVPGAIQKLIDGNSKLVAGCFFDFYNGKDVKFEGKSMTCSSQSNISKDVVLITASEDSKPKESYELFAFR